MKTDVNGCSTCPKGEERWEEFPHPGPSRISDKLIQYDYRHIDGELFSTIALTLELARARRDNWLRNKQ